MDKQVKQVNRIVISIEWKKSRAWGHNPHAHAVITYNDGSTFHDPLTYRCSGCGYDKESTVIADVFNAHLRHTLENLSSKDNKPPYGINPGGDRYPFEGGVGTSCYYTIAEYLGYTFEHISSTKTSDVFVLTKKDK